MWDWLSGWSIRARLYALLAGSTLAPLAILALGLMMRETYRIDGPVYRSIMQDKKLEDDVSQPSLSFGPMYFTLQEMEALTDEGAVRQHEARFNSALRDYEDARDSWLEQLPDGPIRRKFKNEFDAQVREMVQLAREEYFPKLGKGPAAHEQAIRALRKQIQPKFADHRRTSDRLAGMLREKAAATEQEAVEATQFRINALVVLCLGCVLVSLVVGWYTVSGIAGTAGLLTARAREMAGGAGDLTARIEVTSKDEMGELAQAINQVVARIQQIIQRVRESGLQVLSAASQIAATARLQEATVQQLCGSANQMASAVREISATSKELSGTMNDVNERSGHAGALAGQGRAKLHEMSNTMRGLEQSTASISARLSAIREKADSINNVVNTITKVADQTNLLSINAAIEAEKAGEYGRGFLVVAREIRRLADQTAVATLDIENMVRHMHEAVTSGVMQMDKFSEEVRSAVGRVGEVGGQTGQIIEEVHGLSERFEVVNEGMRNQAIGAEQINNEMATVTATIQQTTAAIEEFKSATAQLRGAIEALNKEIEEFTV